MTPWTLCPLLVLLLASIPAFGGEFDEFQVNTYTTDVQSQSAVAVTAEGGFNGFESGDTTSWTSTIP